MSNHIASKDREEDEETEQEGKTTNCLSCNTMRIVQSRDPDNRELFLKMALIDLIVHTLFLVVIIMIADSPGFKQVYDITNSVNSLFVQSPVRKEKPYVTFNNISRKEEVWDYLEHGLISGLFWEVDEGKEADSTDIEMSNILYKNSLLDAAQIRQIKVANATCLKKSVLKKSVLCYFPYGVGEIYKEKLRGTYGTDFIEFNKLGFGKYYGKVSVYGNEGYTYQLPKSKSKVLSNLGTMKTNQWLDRSTRVLLIEFILHNKKLHNYCFVNLAVEFPVTGGVMTSYSLRVVRIARFNFSEILMPLMEICFYLFIFYYLYVIFLEIVAFGFSFFFSIASFIDMVIVFVSLSCLCVQIYGIAATKGKDEAVLQTESIIWLGELYSFYDSALSIVFGLSFLKLFKYLNFNAALWSLSKTVHLCSKELASMIILTGVVYFAFSTAATALFGYDYEEFSSISFSSVSMIRVILGDMDFQILKAGSKEVLGLLFILSFEFLIFLVFLAEFLAIVMVAYSQVTLLHQKQKFEMQMLEYTYRKLAHLFRKKYNEPPLISVKEWNKTMIDLGHPANAATTILNRYSTQGITKDSYLTYPQQDELTYELEFYMKSAYMTEKMKMLLMGYQKLNNLFQSKVDPFTRAQSRVKGGNILGRMLTDIKKVLRKSRSKRDKVLHSIQKELETTRNLLKPVDPSFH